MAQEVDLEDFNRGDTWTTQFTLTDGTNPIDISGYVFWMTLKLDPEVADAAGVQVSVTASGVDATNGIVYVTFDPTKTEALTPASYYYDAQMVISGAVTTIMEGRVKVRRDITRSK